MFEHFAHYYNYYSMQTLNCILKNANTRTHAHKFQTNNNVCGLIPKTQVHERIICIQLTCFLWLCFLCFLENFRLMPNYSAQFYCRFWCFFFFQPNVMFVQNSRNIDKQENKKSSNHLKREEKKCLFAYFGACKADICY